MKKEQSIKNKIAIPLRLQFQIRRYLEHFTYLKFSSDHLSTKISEDISIKRGGVKGRKKEIPVETNLSPESFVTQYLKKSQPVILKGAAKDWTCVKKWSLSFFKENYGDHETPIMDNNNKGSYFNVETMKFSNYIDGIAKGDTRKYMRFGNLLHLFPEIKKDFDTDLIKKHRGPFSLGDNAGVFMGAKGSSTALHAAPPQNFFVQVTGVKRWRIYHADSDPMLRANVDRATYYTTDFDPYNPDFIKYPAAEFLDYYEFDLEPGDILYNPPSFWHHVTNLEPSIGVGFRWMNPLCFKTNFSQMLLFFLALNPPLIYVLFNKKDYTKVLKAAENKKK